METLQTTMLRIFGKKVPLSFTSRRKAEFLDALKEEVLILDNTYKIVYANKGFLEGRKRSLSEIIGNYCYQISQDLDKPCHMSGQVCPLNEALQNRLPDRVIHSREEKGRKRYFEITSSALKDKRGELKGIIELFRDVTDKEKEKEESEQKYRNLIEKSNDAIAILQDNQIKLFNQKLSQLTGYTQEELEGADFREGIAPECRELITDRYARRQKGEEVPDRYQITLLTKDGQRKEVEMGVALTEYQGKVASYCFLQDMTEKKKTENELKKVKDYLDNIINTSQVAITVVDNQGDLSIFNQGAERLTGYKAEEVISVKKIFDFFSDKKELEHIQEKLEESGLIENFETSLLRKDGSRAPISISVSRLKDQEGNPIGSIGISSDITERKIAETALRQSEERLTAIIENTPNVAIEGYELNGNIIYWNKAAERLFGWTREEALGKTLSQLILNKESAEEFHKTLEELDKSNRPPDPSEWKCHNKNGDEVAVYSTIFPIPSSAGKKEFICMDIDITQRKKAEEEIRYLQEFNQEIVEKLPLGVLRLDGEGKIVYENPKMRQIMGVERGGESKALGMRITQMPNVVEAHIVEQMENLLAGTPFSYQMIPFTSLYDKKTILSVNGVPLFDPQGNPEGAILLIEDITESKKIEQKIIQANKELSALNAVSSITNQSLNLDSILDETLNKVLEVTDCQAGGIYILNQADELLELKSSRGLSPEAIREIDRLKLGEGFSGRIARSGEPITVEDINQDLRLARMVMKREGLHSYLGVPLKSKGKILGTLFVITSQDRRYNSGEVELLASIGNQIGMAVENAYLFKEAEQWIVHLEAIRNITNRLNKLNDVKTVASAVMDEIKKVIDFDSCRVFLLSESREELIPIAFGSQVEEYKGETEEVLRLKLGEGITGWVAQTGEGQVVDDGEGHPRSRHIPGSPYVDESIMASPMIYEGVVRGVITLSKLGLKKFNQNHLALLSILANEAVVAIENAKLFEGLKQAYARLKEAQEKLVQSEKLRALGEMAGGVAHDFNNLLGAILGRAQLLLLSAKEQDIRKGLKVIEKAALDGAETVRRIQEFTRLRTDENFISLDPNEILKESLEMTKHKWKDEAQKKGILIQVETDLDQNLPQVAGNPSELREVFVNMILNSIDAMPEGGALCVSSHSDKNQVLARVKDTGIGMTEEVQRKVFDPFFTTKGPKGNGLGLSLAYGIIIRHSGEISIESQRGKGTTFSVKLPLKKLSEKKETRDEKTEEGRAETILIIDDEAAIRELLCDILQSRGYEATGVDDSLKGIELFQKEKFDIVFTDLSMPELSGWEVADRLRSLDPEVVIVMVTGWGTQVDSRKLKAHAVDLLMAKPFEVKKLFEVLDDARKIKRKREEKKLEKVVSG